MNSIDLMSIDQRLTEFNKEMTTLSDKYELSIGAEPIIVDGKIFAKPVLVDRKPKIEPAGSGIIAPPPAEIVTP